MKKLYKTIPVLLLTILLPTNAAAREHVFATTSMVVIASLADLFVLWLLYLAVRKKRSPETSAISLIKEPRKKETGPDAEDSTTYSNMEITVKVNGKTTAVKNLNEIEGVIRSQIESKEKD